MKALWSVGFSPCLDDGLRHLTWSCLRLEQFCYTLSGLLEACGEEVRGVTEIGLEMLVPFQRCVCYASLRLWSDIFKENS